jgi:hypothetical protein
MRRERELPRVGLAGVVTSSAAEGSTVALLDVTARQTDNGEAMQQRQHAK